MEVVSALPFKLANFFTFIEGEHMKFRSISAVLIAGSLLLATQTHAASGKAVYDSACAACHGAGVAGAPKLGDKAVWAARLATGANALHASAIKGKGAMPPKGGNATLSDADIIAAVDFMLAQAK